MVVGGWLVEYVLCHNIRRSRNGEFIFDLLIRSFDHFPQFRYDKNNREKSWCAAATAIIWGGIKTHKSKQQYGKRGNKKRSGLSSSIRARTWICSLSALSTLSCTDISLTHNNIYRWIFNRRRKRSIGIVKSCPVSFLFIYLFIYFPSLFTEKNFTLGVSLYIIFIDIF